MRLIDSEDLYDAISDNWCGIGVANIRDILNFVEETETIDPETLPIVQELREQLEKVTSERDELKKNVRPVVRGEWEAITDPYGNIEGWIHKECGRTTEEASAYCPTCGADMRG